MKMWSLDGQSLGAMPKGLKVLLPLCVCVCVCVLGPPGVVSHREAAPWAECTLLCALNGTIPLDSWVLAQVGERPPTNCIRVSGLGGAGSTLQVG